MNLKKKIINNIDLITKMNENYRQAMRLICCFKIYDLVAASRHMILVLNTTVHLSFQQRIARLPIANGVTGLINARSVRTVIKQSMANVNVSQVLHMSLFQFEMLSMHL